MAPCFAEFACLSSTEHNRFGMKTAYGVFLVEFSTVEICTAAEHGLD